MLPHSAPLGHCKAIGIFCAGVVLLSGCMTPWFRKPSEDSDSGNERRDAIRERLESEFRPTLLKEVSREQMLTLSRIENIGLVSQLPGTGGAVNASQP